MEILQGINDTVFGLQCQQKELPVLIPSLYDMVQFEFCFEQFILPCVGSFDKNEDCSVVVLDNCTIHYPDRILQMVRKKGGLIIYSP